MKLLLALGLLLVVLTSCKDEYKAIPAIYGEWEVHGKLSNAENGQPVAGAAIRFYRVSFWPSWCTFCNPNVVTIASIRSDQNGTYFFSSNVPGSYTISVSKSNYGCTSRYLDLFKAKKVTLDIPMKMRVCPMIL